MQKIIAALALLGTAQATTFAECYAKWYSYTGAKDDATCVEPSGGPSVSYDIVRNRGAFGTFSRQDLSWWTADDFLVDQLDFYCDESIVIASSEALTYRFEMPPLTYCD